MFCRTAQIRHILSLQLILGLIIIAILTTYNYSVNAVLSAVLGFTIAFLSTVVYIVVAFNKGIIAYPQEAFARHQKAMLIRFVINLVAFGLVALLFKRCNLVFLLIAFIVTLGGYWVGLLKSNN